MATLAAIGLLPGKEWALPCERCSTKGINYLNSVNYQRPKQDNNSLIIYNTFCGASSII